MNKWDCSTGLVSVISQKGDLLCRTSTNADQLFVDKLQKENSYAVGFIQKTVWEKYVWGGERNFVVLVCEKNFDPVGYILFTPGKAVGRYAKIQQIAVRQDARRLEYGSLLLDCARQFCEDTGKRGFTLRCRTDLESNHFWQALGFDKYGVWQKGKVNHVGFKASADINLWKIDLNSHFLELPTTTINKEAAPIH